MANKSIIVAKIPKNIVNTNQVVALRPFTVAKCIFTKKLKMLAIQKIKRIISAFELLIGIYFSFKLKDN